MNTGAIRVVEDDHMGVVVLGTDAAPIAIFPERLPQGTGSEDWLTSDIVVEVSGLRSFAVCLELLAVLLENEYPPTLTVVGHDSDAIRVALNRFIQPEVIARLISDGQLTFVEE
jgi:hypothetical protein